QPGETMRLVAFRIHLHECCSPGGLEQIIEARDFHILAIVTLAIAEFMKLRAPRRFPVNVDRGFSLAVREGKVVRADDLAEAVQFNVLLEPVEVAPDWLECV